MNYKYVVGSSTEKYYQVSYGDLEHCSDAVYLSRLIQTDSGVLNALYNRHFGVRLNRIINMPFKGVWNQLYFKNPFERSEKICFVIFAGRLYLDQYGLLHYLRNTYRNCKIVCFCQDISETFRGVDPANLKNKVDLVLSFDQRDCEKYGWEYYPLVYSMPRVEDDLAIPESDVYFVGKAKNRLNDILAAYEKLKAAGMKCDFHITGVPEAEQKYADEIHYCTRMPYEENLQRIRKTRCMLEIMQQGGHGYTLRYCEAIALGRRMITNNPEIKGAPFYREDLISTFESIEDMDVEFVRRGDQQVEYQYIDKLSPLRLIEYIDKRLSEKQTEVRRGNGE